MKRLISAILMFSMLFVSIFSISSSALTSEASPLADLLAPIITGKIFYNGENEHISEKSQLDTSISNVKIYNDYSSSLLSFDFNKETIKIESFLLDAEINNIDNDHFVLSPVNFNSEIFDIVTIRLTTNANDYDLMPVNFDLLGKNVLSIMMKDKFSNDLYYWQGEIEVISATKNNKLALSETPILSTLDEAEYSNLRKAVNEEYYLQDKQFSFTLTAEEYENQINEFEINKANETNNVVTIAAASSMNPFYDYYDMPNSAFQTVTNRWTQGVAWVAYPIEGIRSVNYYTNSYALSGDTNRVFTKIMLVEFMDTRSQGTTGGYNTATRKLVIKVRENHTVVYYKSTSLYDLELGGERQVKFYPTINMEKTGSNQGHILATRRVAGIGYTSAGVGGAIHTIGTIALGIGIISNPFVNGLITTVISAYDLITGTSTTMTQFLGAGEFVIGYSISDQMARWNKVVGGHLFPMEGYIRDIDNYFETAVTYSASTSAIANQNTWTLSASIGG